MEAGHSGQTAATDISVLFATRNRHDQLAETLAAYRALDTNGLRWELVVVDNGSNDDSAHLLKAARADLPLRTLTIAQHGQNRARNAAIAGLCGELVVFTDDDVLPATDCLRAYLDAARRWPHEIIFGARVDPRFPDGTPDWLIDPGFEFSSTAFARYAPADSECRVKRHPYGPSFMVRRAAIGAQRFATHLGPAEGNYAMGGESDFLRRLAGERYHYVYVPSARVQHVVRAEQITAEWLLARAQKKGRGQVYLPTDKKQPRLFVGGVSIKLWLATLRAALRYYLVGRLGSARRRLELGIRYRLRLGQVRELRQQHRVRATKRA